MPRRTSIETALARRWCGTGGSLRNPLGGDAQQTRAPAVNPFEQIKQSFNYMVHRFVRLARDQYFSCSRFVYKPMSECCNEMSFSGAWRPLKETDRTVLGNMSEGLLLPGIQPVFVKHVL